MARSDASTVEQYLEELSEDQREVISEVRRTVLENLPEGFQESMNWGMITYEVPLERYPDTYNGEPLMYAALAAQKRHYSLYLTSVYQDPERLERLKDQFREAGKKVDMGKSCVRFKKLDDLPLEVIGQVIASDSVDEFVRGYENR